MSSAALVGTDGSVDWCCFPRFDSPSVFAAILDPEVGGHFRIAPTGPVLETRQEYLPDTNILLTTFTTSTGVVSVTDFMPAADDDDDNPETPPNALHEIHRIVTCLSGEVELRCDFQPRHDYARASPVPFGGRTFRRRRRARRWRPADADAPGQHPSPVRRSRRQLQLHPRPGPDGDLRPCLWPWPTNQRGTAPHR